jgi:integrase
MTPHLRTVENLLSEVATHFTGRRVSEIHAPELAAWWNTRGGKLSNKSRRDIRGHLVTFWRWALRQGIAGTDPVTAAERLPAPRVETGEKRILTADELCAVLDATEPRFRAHSVLSAFAGLRPEEIAPKTAEKGKKARKRGLHCEEIDWQFGVIRLPAEVAKGGTRPRNIPMNEALKAGLQWAGIQPGMRGPVCLLNPTEEQELKRLGMLIFKTGWPKDALRHSFGSYRNAILRNLPQVSEEMGNSVAILNKHYHNPQPEQLGHQGFALRPQRSAGDTMKWSKEIGHQDRSQPQPIEISA